MSGKARYSVPTPTPARSASSGIEASRPRCAKSSLAAARMRARLRSASARRGRDGAERQHLGRERTPRPGAHAQIARTGTLFPYTTRNALSGYELEAPHGHDDHLSLARRLLRRRQAPRHLARARPRPVVAGRRLARAALPRGVGRRRPASSTSCSTRARPAAGASTWSRPPRPLEEIEQRLDGWRDVVGDWGSVHWLRDRLGLPDGRGARRASCARRGRRGLELALLGPGHLDRVLGRRVARDDVVGRLVVGEVDDDVRLARRDVEQVAGLDLERLLEVLAPVDRDRARRACRGRSRSWRGSAGASARRAARGSCAM